MYSTFGEIGSKKKDLIDVSKYQIEEKELDARFCVDLHSSRNNDGTRLTLHYFGCFCVVVVVVIIVEVVVVAVVVIVVIVIFHDLVIVVVVA